MKTTCTRREFNQFILLFTSLFTVAASGRPAKKEKPQPLIPATGEEIEGCKLFIDLPPNTAWNLDRHLDPDEWNQLWVNPLDLSPRIAAQLQAAKAVKYGTPVLLRVLGDPVAALLKARYLEPGSEVEYSDHDSDAWRIEYFRDGIRRIKPDNSSWWTHRLEPIADHPEWNACERAFAEMWRKENSRSWSGESGILQALMFSTLQHEKPPQFEPWVTNRERKIVATVVQWLGTNCGRSFLYEVQKKAGVKIA